jgi:hypothetical protein
LETIIMATLLLENVPPAVYERLRRRAEAKNQPVPEEAIRILEKGLAEEEPVEAKDRPVRLPDPPFLTEEMTAPFTLPLPGEGVIVQARPGGKRLPPPFEPPDEQS